MTNKIFGGYSIDDIQGISYGDNPYVYDTENCIAFNLSVLTTEERAELLLALIARCQEEELRYSQMF